MASCCTPGRGTPGVDGSGADTPAVPDAGRLAPGIAGATRPQPGPASPDAWCRIDACEFLMGSDAPEAVAGDGEGPVRRVSVSAFAIAPATVTNREFGDFVRATRYVTDAERLGSAFVFYLQLPEFRRAAARRIATGMPWWLAVDDACWQRPEGPGSQVRDRPGHPVVQVSWNDAQAYCRWAGVRLPTEAQWECAARGGLPGRRFAWGDELMRDGLPRCNVWRGEFPNRPAAGWMPGPVEAMSGEPNGHGLYNVCGNVWEWCEDVYTPDYHRCTPAHDPVWLAADGRRAMRGGSFLCHDSYCNRYRVSARHANTADTATSNLGFRVVAPAGAGLARSGSM